jgi:hypothetical protein
LEIFAFGDIIDNYIFSDQNWSLQETHGHFTCVYPSYVLNNNIDTKKLNNDFVGTDHIILAFFILSGAIKANFRNKKYFIKRFINFSIVCFLLKFLVFFLN